MRNFVFALALLLAGSGVAFADSIPTVVNAAAGSGRNVWTMTVFNDAGRTVNSGEIVVWDQADSDVTSSQLPYVTTSSTADDVYTAGVMVTTCLDQSQCDIVVRGITTVRCMDSSDAVAAGTTVGQSASDDGMCGDYTPAANKTSLGVALEAGGGTNYEYLSVYVNPTTGEQ